MFSEPQIQYTAYAVGAAAALAALEVFMGIWGPLVFTLATGQNFYSRQLHDAIPLPGFPIVNEQSNNAFGVAVTYAYATGK
jgi:hypothetical protein